MGKGIVALGLPGQLMRQKVQLPDLAHFAASLPACLQGAHGTQCLQTHPVSSACTPWRTVLTVVGCRVCSSCVHTAYRMGVGLDALAVDHAQHHPPAQHTGGRVSGCKGGRTAWALAWMPSSSITRSTSRPPAQHTGLPPNVLKCRRCAIVDAISGVVTTAASGSPLPMPYRAPTTGQQRPAACAAAMAAPPETACCPCLAWEYSIGSAAHT